MMMNASNGETHPRPHSQIGVIVQDQIKTTACSHHARSEEENLVDEKSEMNE